MQEPTNPVKRLHNIVSKVIDHSRTSGISSGHPAQSVWISAFNLTEENILRNLYSTTLLIDSCEQMVMQEQALNHEPYLGMIQKAKKGIYSLSTASGSWGTFREVFSDEFMISLFLISENISLRGTGEEAISEECLATLQMDIEGLITRVVDSALDSEIKNVLLDGLESVRQAIMDYRILGAESIRQALDRNFGLLHRFREDFKTAYESNDRQVVVDFLGFLKNVDMVVSTASKIKQLAAPVIDRMIESGG